MEHNERRLCTNISRHIDIRYFFVKSRIDKKEVRVKHCPMEKMLSDYFTKPLQGELFKFYRNIIVGYISIGDIISLDDEMKNRVRN